MVMGFPVFDSDSEAKNLMVHNASVVKKIRNIFGDAAYVQGELNRKFLAQQIFNNPQLKDQLSNIVHPAVRQSFEHWCKKQTAPIVFNEAAILFETGRYKDFDYTILVTAPENIRIRRVIQRDQTTTETVKSRMDNQWKDEEKKKLASFIIVNDDRELVTLQIEKILSQLNFSI